MIPSENPAARPLCAALLFGGLSSEHEVSRVSAGTFADNMDPEKYELIKIGITKEGRWLYTEATSAQMADGSWEELPGNMPCVLSPDRADHGAILFTPSGHVEKLHLDVVIPVLHGLPVLAHATGEILVRQGLHIGFKRIDARHQRTQAPQIALVLAAENFPENISEHRDSWEARPHACGRKGMGSRRGGHAPACPHSIGRLCRLAMP